MRPQLQEDIYDKQDLYPNQETTLTKEQREKIDRIKNPHLKQDLYESMMHPHEGFPDEEQR